MSTLPPTASADEAVYNHALAACARGDKAALRMLYDREGAKLLGVAMRIVRDRALAEDVLHDAFVNIWTKAASFDAARGSGRGWIYAVVRNQALTTVRTRGREVSADEEAMEALDADASMDAAQDTATIFELNASLGKLNDCLAQLDGTKRTSILYAYIDGCSHGEIAQRMRAPLGTVKAWIRRGMASLQDCMA
ncbi:MAG: sigma-70 family RNA polymerase sigma factor [Burkholderiaceae bacterium]